MEKLERPVQGQVLTAEYLGRLVDIVNALLGLSADGSSGLELVKKDSGWTLRLNHTITSFGKAATGVTAMSGATLGSGNCELYVAIDGVLTATGITVTAYNSSGTAVASNAMLQLIMVDGVWTVASEDCT